jgi:FdrA protein
MSNLCEAPLSVVTFGLESFNQALLDQGVDATWVDWRPPAGGNQRLLEILEQMR